MFAKTLLISAFAALAAAQSAVLTFTRVPNPVTDGEPQVILYSTNDTSTPVTIILRQGASGNLQTVQTLTTTATDGQFVWTPPKSLPNGINYALQITQADQVNYYGPFTVQGASPGAVSSASMSSVMSSMSSSVTGSMTTMAAGNATAPATGNSTMTMTGTASSGTGMTMSRNTTMSSPTLAHTGHATMTGGSSASASSGAGYQGTSTGGSSPSQTGNAAASDFSGKSTVAFVLGALAAVLYVQ